MKAHQTATSGSLPCRVRQRAPRISKRHQDAIWWLCDLASEQISSSGGGQRGTPSHATLQRIEAIRTEFCQPNDKADSRHD